MLHYDLIVVGGGFAGACAAIAAAREGSNVLLVEKENCLGGAACANLVFPFMSYKTKNPQTGEEIVLSQGIFGEIVRNMKALNPKFNDFHYTEEYLKLVLNRMATEAGVHLLFHATLGEVRHEDGRVRSITVFSVSGETELSADCFIDATGNGDLAVRAGCGFTLGRPGDHLCQPMTLCFRVANVDKKMFFREELPGLQKLYKQYRAEGKIKNPREDILVFDLPVEGVLHFNSTRIVKHDPTDLFSVTEAEIEVREQVFELFDFLRENAKSFEKAELLSTAADIGKRESRMIHGDYELTEEDLVACTKFDDAVCCGNYDIDIHNPEGSGTSHYYFAPGTYYTIPYRALVAKDAENLLVAGRCISSTHEAQASYRIMPIVATIGEAAGVAAALAKPFGGEVRKISVKKLQDVLRENGAFLG